MKRLRVSTCAFLSGMEASPGEADQYLVQFIFEMGCKSLLLSAEFNELELANELIKLANEIKGKV